MIRILAYPLALFAGLLLVPLVLPVCALHALGRAIDRVAYGRP